MAKRLIRGPLFVDRRDAGSALAAALETERSPELVVVGLARGGVVTAAEIATALAAPLDVVAVRKIGYPWQPEYGIGAVTPGTGIYVRATDGLTKEQLANVVEATKLKAALLDKRLHDGRPALDLGGKRVLVVDDGLATGATMIAALRWARGSGAVRVVAAVPVAPSDSLGPIGREADEVVCLHPLEHFVAVGHHYAFFEQVDDDAVIRLLDENRREREQRAPFI